MSLLGEVVKGKRERLNVGVRDAAKLSGVSPATLSRVECGEDSDIKTFAKLCAWLDLAPTMFLNGKGLR